MAVNINAIPKELIESELFGHEKGAFTGANEARVGKFEAANKGTLFIDEIGDMDIALQVKLLRVLQEREVVKVGGNKVVAIDVRIITATHRNLAEEVKKGNFREDLYFRLFGFPIAMPPLMERQDDIFILAKSFLDAYCSSNKMGKVTFSADAKKKLHSYPYPGNVRELKAIVELSAVMSENGIIEAGDISFPMSGSAELSIQSEDTLEQITNKAIRLSLKKHNNNYAVAAQKLGISKSTLYRLVKNMEPAIS